MISKGRLLSLVAIAAVVLSVVSFLGGSVGSLIAGREPFALLGVGPPHVEVPPGHPFGALPVTNTLLATWLSSSILIAIFLLATRKVKLVPSGLQNAVEYLCEFGMGFIEEMVGKGRERRFFPVVMTVFLFVLFNAWLSLLPGFETVKLNGVPLVRSANTDINLTLMLAIVCVVAVEYWGLKARGVEYLKTFFDVRRIGVAVRHLLGGRIGDGFASLFYGVIFAFVGFLELLSHGVRILSFSFRLFGNMTAGVVLTAVALFLVPLVLPTVFYGLEALFGVVQALIFAGLTAVFGYAAVNTAEH
ncbi:MAG: F0F1 ATP synthase subunit A [Dehalococcoidia bacterium]|nr:F0F1 ATP synthase subunit A [Dehalococcoidia bacterium]